MYSKSGAGGPGFRTKKKQKEDSKAGEDESKKASSAQIRLQRDLADLDLPENVKLVIPNKDEIMAFSLVIQPRGGYWDGGIFEFTFEIPAKYPFDGPKVQCIDKLYHPNIDLEGKVCVNVLRPWKPTYSVQIVLFGLLFLFSHPNPNDPLNNEAAADMRKDKNGFGTNVLNALKGKRVEGVQFSVNRGKKYGGDGHPAFDAKDTKK